ncbi:WavE lipopolysaccharide synthesis family protein [Pseudomonas sp. DTU_2021_1001937_2_SI_NGA_ILE_001]|uniref:WavE lipopolysaccharide synthesis family protein n=1 Tax=Pseudomonas sp. DTU_2021_1001937_2_SI_NGA_ILE_001 TaxID=3077589 RepID=UPI0028FC1CB1|nr:WavE lipopolysaccharide synthesis family protein [Pseudomonas sp. DTU_2021_1001937_2_SI_NGA_ILE_001]WNW13231.1 WavE lipopolysaccharide synthesis family protein [Pseudomonas sp. DTU_2021_1001937_2_SI_NGA_ILE_001]
MAAPVSPVAVDSALISVVIQGPLCRELGQERNILACIASVRRHLPQARIVVSTWRGEDTTDLEVEQLVLLDDPGGLRDVSGNPVNTNRMILSTRAGIQAADRPYVMKLRADHNLRSADLAVIGQPIPVASDGLSLFDAPITLTNLYMRDPERVPMLFHLSDLVQFGTREAMLALWNQPLFAEHELLHPGPSRNPFGNFLGYSALRMIPEQALLLGCLRQRGIHLTLTHPCRVRLAPLKLWDTLLTRNFTVLDHTQAGVDFPERFLAHEAVLRTLYTPHAIARLARREGQGCRWRLLKIWFNQHLLSFTRPGWWVALASMVLFNMSPALARRLRAGWRKARGTGSDAG